MFEREKSLSGQVTNEHRLSFEGTLKWQINDIKLSNRHLVSHRDISGRGSWTYRNKLKIAYLVEIKRLSIVPFIRLRRKPRVLPVDECVNIAATADVASRIEGGPAEAKRRRVDRGTTGYARGGSIADEIFYDTIPDKFNQNRFSIGFSRHITKHSKFEIYYLLNSKRARQGNWDEVNVAGTAFGITF